MRLKKLLSGLLVSLLVLSQIGMSVSATDDAAANTDETASDTAEGASDTAADGTEDAAAVDRSNLTPEELKALKYETPADTNSLKNWPEGPNIYADSGCVIDMESGAIVYAKNMDAQKYPASITKLLTVLVALQNAELTDTVTFSEDSIAFLEYGDAHIGMKAGEEISMEDALYAILLASANEVSYAVAETVGTNDLGGDYSTFIQEMNNVAKDLGCSGSHWTNANGLHDENHYTTAHDMALIASAVYEYEEFRTIMETYEYVIEPTEMTDEKRVFQQNHKMLWEGNDYSWELATGGKTGYTDQSGTTLVTMAEENGMKLACVVLDDYGGDAYTDTRAMMEYVFDNFEKVSLSGAELPAEISALTDSSAYVLLPEGVEITDLECEVIVAENDETTGGTTNISAEDTSGESAEDKSSVTAKSMTGTAVFTYEDQIVGEAEVVLDQDVLVEQGVIAHDAEVSEPEKDSALLKVVKGLWIALGAAVLIVAYIFYKNYKIMKERKKRRLMRKRREKMLREQELREQQMREQQLRERQQMYEQRMYERRGYGRKSEEQELYERRMMYGKYIQDKYRNRRDTYRSPRNRRHD